MISGLHHVSIATSDMERTLAFYAGVLGMQPCPTKANWLWAGNGFGLHVMPAKSESPAFDPARHFALEVERLEAVVALLLEHGYQPYQLGGDQTGRHDILTQDDPLTFGIGTVFVQDPDGNSVEFVQSGRGIIGDILGRPTA